MPSKAEMGGQFVRFFIVGIGATLLHLLVYWLINACFNLSEANTFALNISYSLGYLVSFVGNYIISLKWTFKTEGSVKKGLGFALSHLINYGMHMGLLNLFLWLSVGAGIVQLITWLTPWAIDLLPLLGQADKLLPFPIYVIVVPLNFLLVRYFLTAGDKKA